MSHPSGAGPSGDDEDGGIPAGPIPKPDELLLLHGVTAELFDTLKAWFDIDDSVALDLTAVDSAVTELGDPQMVVALAMRKLQALHLLATPGVRTVTDVVVAIINDLERAMVQAPNMWLKRRAAATDWDDAFAALSDDLGVEEDRIDVVEDHDGDGFVGEADVIDRFRYLHSMLHDAMFSVIEASEGAIRELE